MAIDYHCKHGIWEGVECQRCGKVVQKPLPAESAVLLGVTNEEILKRLTDAIWQLQLLQEIIKERVNGSGN